MDGATTWNPDHDRRTVLRRAGAGALAFTAFTASSQTATADNHDDGDESAGMLVLIYDDSPRKDYTKVFPIHQEHDVPGCVAVCPGFMGSHSKWMHPGHLEEMYEAGWEVMGHSLEHRSLGRIPVRGDIEEGDTEIIVQSNLHGQYSGDPLVVFDGDTETTVTSAGREEQGSEDVLLLEEPIDESFEAGDGWETWVRYTDEFTNHILEETKAQIEEWGFGPVTSWVYPFDRDDGYVSEIVPEYYDAVPNSRSSGLNPTFDPDPFRLGRENFETDRKDESDLAEFLDVVADEPDFGILYGHADRESLTEERINTVIQMANERNIDIVTLQTALERIEQGDNGGREDGGETDDTDDETNDDGQVDDSVPGDDTDGRTGTGSESGMVQSMINQIQVMLRSIVESVTGLFS